MFALTPAEVDLQRALVHQDSEGYRRWRKTYPIEAAGKLLPVAGRRLETDEQVKGVLRHRWTTNQQALSRAREVMEGLPGERLLLGDAFFDQTLYEGSRLIERVRLLVTEGPARDLPPVRLLAHASRVARWPGADAAMWQDAQPFEPLPCLAASPEHQLVWCLTESRHPLWTLDAALLIDRGGLDWDRVADLGRAWRQAAWCARALEAIAHHLGPAPPQGFCRDLSAGAGLWERVALTSRLGRWGRLGRPVAGYLALHRPGTESLQGLVRFGLRKLFQRSFSGR